jgi:predicted tellurium resistance membrane protein TerC
MTEAIIPLLSLISLEVILGIDNIIFISILADKLPDNQRSKLRFWGIGLAMVMRLFLLAFITWILKLDQTLFTLFNNEFSGKGLILILGGLFLIYKSTKEIHEKVDHKGEEEKELKTSATKSFGSVIGQILLIDIIFSVDSILTAVGMTNGIEGALLIMICAVVISVGVMMLFAAPVGNFVNANPSIQILGLAFLILIGFMLITESMHLSHAELAGEYVGAVPKGYLYFAIAFSLAVEFINMKMRKKN